MHKPLATALLCASLLSACGGPPAPAETTAAAAKPLLVLAQDLLTVQPQPLTQGPVISGSIQPERRAELRAEVAGVVLSVLKDNGDVVSKGEVLMRLDPTVVRDKLLSAEEAERAAEVALAQAERQYERVRSLFERKLVSTEAVETAEGRRNQTQSELASARARAVEARQQMERTEVRAPLDGVVGARSVSAGDTVQLGMSLVSVLDVGSMRFEGLVAADQVALVTPGAKVHFRVNGYPGQSFEGEVQRVNPLANESTRQVQVLVALPPAGAPAVAGMYAEGRIDVTSRPALLLPESALVRDGDEVAVWQIKDAALHRVRIELGDQDAGLGRFEVRSGLSDGDQVLRHPLGALKDGAPVELAPASAAAGR